MLSRKTLPSSDQEMIAKILAKGTHTALNEEEAGYLQARIEYLTDDEKEQFGLGEKKASKKKGKEAKEAEEPEETGKPGKKAK